MNSTREQAQVYLAQGSLCRAAVTMQNVVNVEPTAENCELLAEIYLKQGLHDDAFEMYAKAAGKSIASTTNAALVN